MIKVLSGKYKGRKLKNFKNNNVRPTSSRVKKSIMDTIMPLEGKIVLDLFSGVGNLGIEALSRGAKFVSFVERDFRIAKLLKSNLDILNIQEGFEIIISDVNRFFKTSEKKYDIVIADPPYFKYKFLEIFPLVNSLLLKDGMFCYESEKQHLDTDLDIKIKMYGNTQVIFWSKKS
tara:strand:+ start:1083 stop:1607 length:525 start_codon:yes stop_codon:yes gene_type:complete